jgi:glycosyltransferase involved in cell wall biosynthesis
MRKLSIVLPARDETAGLSRLLPELRSQFPDAELIVVNDGSTDDTGPAAAALGARVISHSYSMGNGAAVKAGARAASGEILVLMDSDGQHSPKDVQRLLGALENGVDMVVGARVSGTQANVGRGLANAIYNRLASWMVNHKIADLTSGFRVVRAEKFREFLYLLPNGFSYPTTITMSFFRVGYSVIYVPINATARIGKSHISPIRDGIRFLLIIFKVGTLYSPLKLFFPISAGFFFAGLGYYVYTFISVGRFTNMSALLLTSSMIIFLIGLVSEQITSILYMHRDK